MSRLHTAGRSIRYPFVTGSLNSAVSILYLTLGANKPVLIRRLVCTGRSVTNSQVETAWSLETGGSPSAGTPITGVVMDGDATGPTVTVKTGVTGETYTDANDDEREGWPSLGGYKFKPPTADEWLFLTPGSGNKYGFRIITAPAATSIYVGALELMELV